jgi:4-hydroxy-3-methylbut-2-en-1-yl diphosphate reductase
MTIAVTGAAGFVGANLVRSLESDGRGAVLAVDEGKHEPRFRRGTGSGARYVDKDAFLELAGSSRLEAVVHLGACTDTSASWDVVRATNLEYSLRLLRTCVRRRIPLVYASSAAVYGMGHTFVEDGSCDAPTTPYGRSKYLVDRAARALMPGARSQVVGLRYFNVYGPGEEHKGRMASLALQLHRQLADDGVCRIFAGCDGYADGDQRRDFVWVGDVVAVTRWFLDRPEASGIFNVGTGRSRSFNELAATVVAASGGGAVQYVPFPPELRGAWQSFTEADLSRLREAGYSAPFRPLEDAVPAYIEALRTPDRDEIPRRRGAGRVLLASPRGQCAGVDRAIVAARSALARFGTPLYIRRQLVHNAHVVAELEALGAVFVRELDEVPPGSTHGVAPAVWDEARRRELRVVDTTCPLVTKVHSEVRHYTSRGYTVLLIGHAGHDEVEGTMGEAPEHVLLVETLADAARVEPPPDHPLAYVSQTTLSLDDTAATVALLRRRFPEIEGPRKEDICYATTNRQRAVKELLPEIDLLLVIGSPNSSNSQRLVEVGLAGGIPAYLVEDETAIDEAWLRGAPIIGLTSGASAPEELVERVLEWLRAHGHPVVEEREHVDEDVHFALPQALR